MMTNLDFKGWEQEAFGYGYGTGEEPVLTAVRDFFAWVEEEGDVKKYDYEVMENKLGKTVAWLLINVMCKTGIIEYGTSPRYGWLTAKGRELMDFFGENPLEEMYDIINQEVEE